MSANPQQTSLAKKGSRNSSSPKRSSPSLKPRNFNGSSGGAKKPQTEPSKLLLAPKPFSRQDSSKSRHIGIYKPEFKSQTLPSKKTSSTTSMSKNKKPAVPPKPRNVIVKQKSSCKLRNSEITRLPTLDHDDDKSELNDSGFSGNLLWD